ncbi:hypothetical protein DSAG12_02170 [Promethearchaeum syntrophicum]|uniref:Uncharacterized protein n=1 Tax=Promethearchaeum syntrophicum TaxID=2594042 RepID=A0A5B9DC58_9ARCH|nr:hypothetical protein [Candidatus Prometheoarchaeum syntrophicum]QEE16340.1 hypothetical protein DSAG12_02170 [Candidatus Prometheoarchaeum syntrophicum]
MKKSNNKISIAGIFLFCTIIVGFVFVPTPLNLRLPTDGGDDPPPPPPRPFSWVTLAPDQICDSDDDIIYLSWRADSGYGDRWTRLERKLHDYDNWIIVGSTSGWSNYAYVTFPVMVPTGVGVGETEIYDYRVTFHDSSGSHTNIAEVTVVGPSPPTPFSWITLAPDQTCDEGDTISLSWRAISGYGAERWTTLEQSLSGDDDWEEIGSTSGWSRYGDITYSVTVPTVGWGETEIYDYRVNFHDSSPGDGNHYDTAVVTVVGPPIPTPFNWLTLAGPQTCDVGDTIYLTWKAESGFSDRWTQLERSLHGYDNWINVDSTAGWSDDVDVTFEVTVPTDVGVGETEIYDYRVNFHDDSRENYHDSSYYTGNHYNITEVTVVGPRAFSWLTLAGPQTCDLEEGNTIYLTWKADSGFGDDRWTTLERSLLGEDDWEEVDSTSGWSDNEDVTYEVTVPTVEWGETEYYEYKVNFHDSSPGDNNHEHIAEVTVVGLPGPTPFKWLINPPLEQTCYLGDGNTLSLTWKAESGFDNDRWAKLEYKVKGIGDWMHVEYYPGWLDNDDVTFPVILPAVLPGDTIIYEYKVTFHDDSRVSFYASSESSGIHEDTVEVTVVGETALYLSLTPLERTSSYGTSISLIWKAHSTLDSDHTAELFQDSDPDPIDSKVWTDGEEISFSVDLPVVSYGIQEVYYHIVVSDTYDTVNDTVKITVTGLADTFLYDDPDDGMGNPKDYCGVAFVAWEESYSASDVAYSGELPDLNELYTLKDFNYVQNLKDNGYKVFHVSDYEKAEYFDVFLEALALADVFDTRMFVMTFMHGAFLTGTEWKVPNDFLDGSDITFGDFTDQLTPEKIISSAAIHYPGYVAEGQVEELIFYAAPCFAMTALIPNGLGYNLGTEDDGLKRISKAGVIFGVKGEQGKVADLPRFLHNYIINGFSLVTSYDHAHDDASDVRYIHWGTTGYIWDKPLFSTDKPNYSPINDGKLDRHESEYINQLLISVEYTIGPDIYFHSIITISTYIETSATGDYFTKYNWAVDYRYYYYMNKDDIITHFADPDQDASEIFCDFFYVLPTGEWFIFDVTYYSDGSYNEYHTPSFGGWVCEIEVLW